MPFIPLIAAGVAAAGSIVGGAIQSGAQDRASGAQERSAQQGLDFQREQWQTQQKNQAPYLAAGQAALPGLTEMAIHPGQFQFNTSGPNADPSYQWRLNQGLAGVNASAAARGGYFSGATGQALNAEAQGLASTEYGNQFQRYLTTEQNQFNQLYNVANMGQGATQALGNAGSQFATNAGNIAMNQGNNQANAAINQGNIWSGTLQGVGNQFMSAWGQQQQQNALNQAPGWNVSNSGAGQFQLPQYSMLG